MARRFMKGTLIPGNYDPNGDRIPTIKYGGDGEQMKPDTREVWFDPTGRTFESWGGILDFVTNECIHGTRVSGSLISGCRTWFYVRESVAELLAQID